jgi:phage major head subunit gpT-like protein
MNCGESGGDVLAYEMKLYGTDFIKAAKALGAWVDDGKAPVNIKPTALSPRQALSVMGFEATLVAIEAARLANGAIPSADDLKRLLKSANRITRLVEDFE